MKIKNQKMKNKFGIYKWKKKDKFKKKRQLKT